MAAKYLVCRSCGKTHTLKQHYSCAECGDILDVVRDASESDREVIRHGGEHFSQGMWKYFEMLPVTDPANVITMGEGGTPLVVDTRIPDLWHCDASLLIKAESLNPSGSFKDRPTSVGISVAKELRQNAVVVSSSGNAGAAVAAYAARAGMRCVVVIPETTDPGKVTQAGSHGAEILGVRGSLSNCYRIALELSVRRGWTNLVSTFLNPYTVEADKTVAYELFDQMRGSVPDYIFVPIGSGPLLIGVYKGYAEMFGLEMIKRMPRMIGVQVRECEPITVAYENGDRVRPWEKPIHTMAGGIADPLMGYECNGDLTIRTVRESGGAMISLSEDEVAEATRLLETKVGLYSEPTGAVAVGGLKRLHVLGQIDKGSTAVCLMTGHGFKYSRRERPEMKVVENVEQALDALG